MVGRLAMVLALLGGVSGCAQYQYDIITPPQFHQHIGTQKQAVVSMRPIEYRFITYQNYLVVRIDNAGKEPMLLRGDLSVIVDPSGLSHPVRGIMIYPGAHLRLVLPPLMPEPAGEFGPDAGLVWGADDEDEWNDQFFSGPIRPAAGVDVYSASLADARFWNWPAGTDVRLVLTYQADDHKPITQMFLLRRVKM